MKDLFAGNPARMGGPDIAIDTVGKVSKKSMADRSEAEYDWMAASNDKFALFLSKGAGRRISDSGKTGARVASQLGGPARFYAAYPSGNAAPLEHFTDAATKACGAYGILVTAMDPGPMDTPILHPGEGVDAAVVHQTVATLSPLSKAGLSGAEDVLLFIRQLVINGGYTIK